MDKADLDAIANRKTTCHPFGETVSLSRAERDQLVALARDGLRWKFGVSHQFPSQFTEAHPQKGKKFWVDNIASQEEYQTAEAAIDAAMAAEFGKNMEKV